MRSLLALPLPLCAYGIVAPEAWPGRMLSVPAAVCLLLAACLLIAERDERRPR